jgi:hypothetical protein
MKNHLLLLFSGAVVAAILFTGCLTRDRAESGTPKPPEKSTRTPSSNGETAAETKKPDTFGSLFISTITAGEVVLDTGETFLLPENGSILINKLEPDAYRVTIRYPGEHEEQLSVFVEKNSLTEASFTWAPEPEKMHIPAEKDVEIPDTEGGPPAAEAEKPSEEKREENPIRKIRLLTGTYTGLLKDGRRHGYGKMELLNGDRYEGAWYKDQKHGFGTYVWENGDVYKGQWHNDKRHGTGTYNLANGDSYSGSWNEGQMHGIGIYTWSNGDYYEGRWVEGKKEGKGLYKTADGGSYEGEWEDDTMNGIGTFIWSDGDRYSGEWKNGLMHGEGTFYVAYRGRYEGTFKNGRAVGGWYYLQDGTKKWASMNEHGEWELKEKDPATAPSS